MTKKVDTWMPLLIDKYLGDTTHLTTELHGAYLLLLMTMWKRDGSLPNDDAQLQPITRLSPAKWRTSRSVLMAFFRVDESGNLRQKRLAFELVNANKRSEAKAEAGSKGAAKRWQKDGTTNGTSDGTSDGKTYGTAIADEKQTASQTGASISIPIPLPSGDKDPPATRVPPAEAGKKPTDLRASDLEAEGVEPAVARDWLRIRKAKRAPLTQTAWDGLKREASAAGMTPAQAVKHATENGWQGFKASWLDRAPQTGVRSAAEALFETAK